MTRRGAISEVLLLLAPKARSVLNSIKKRKQGQRGRAIGLAVLGVGLWVGILLVSIRVLAHVQREIPDFWELIHFKLMSMAFLTFFSMLLFSNVVTSLSAYFLSEDLDLVLAVPTDIESVYYAKFIETTVISSWMIFVFGLPVIIAFGWVWNADIGYYLLALAIEIPFLLIPAGMGIMLTMTLVKIFPARRARDLLVLLSIVIAGVIFILFRLIRPEQFVQATARMNLWEGVLTFEANDFVPSEWLTRVLMEYLRDRPMPWMTVGLLAATGFSLLVLGAWLANWIYRDGWSKAQEGRRARISRSGPFSLFVKLVAMPYPKSMRPMVVKDVKTFFRDTTQWSQLFLLAAIMVVYVFNFKALPLTALPINQFKLVNMVSFANLAMAAFVVSAVAVRFVFPMVSLEGNAYWLIRASPLRPKPYLWSKFVVSLLPLLVLSEILLVTTNYLLKVSPLVAWLNAATILIMTLGITGFGVGMGAMYPRFDVENAAQIPVSYGGVVYMVVSLGFIAVSAVLVATPTSAIFFAQFKGATVDPFLWWALGGALALITAMSAALLFVSMRRGIKSLESMGD